MSDSGGGCINGLSGGFGEPVALLFEQVEHLERRMVTLDERRQLTLRLRLKPLHIRLP